MRSIRLPSTTWSVVVLLLVWAPLYCAAVAPRVVLPDGHMDPATERALAAMMAVEDELSELRSLDPARRRQRQEGMLRSLERLRERAAGTRVENKALYYLADWQATHGDRNEAWRLLDQLAALESPAYSLLGQVLRVRLMLDRGRVQDARPLAEDVIGRAPEFAPVLDLVTLHERVGQPAPRTHGRALTGGPEDPARSRAAPWLLYCFVVLADGDQRFAVASLLQELAREPYAETILPVIVSFDGDPLTALGTLRSLAEDTEVDLLWANPAPGGEADEWRRAWRLSSPPLRVLLDPARNIMAIDPSIERLRPLVGLDPDDNGLRRPRAVTWRGRRR